MDSIAGVKAADCPPAFARFRTALDACLDKCDGLAAVMGAFDKRCPVRAAKASGGDTPDQRCLAPSIAYLFNGVQQLNAAEYLLEECAELAAESDPADEATLAYCVGPLSESVRCSSVVLRQAVSAISAFDKTGAADVYDGSQCSNRRRCKKSCGDEMVRFDQCVAATVKSAAALADAGMGLAFWLETGSEPLDIEPSAGPVSVDVVGGEPSR